MGLPLQATQGIRGLLEELRSCGADLKVVEPGNLHVTLKFLGEVPEAQAVPILGRLRAAGFPARFRVSLRGVGAFPDWRRLNTLWVGLQDPEGHVATCFVQSERVFAELGFPPEPRAFSPHATIARRRGEEGKEAAKRVLERHRDEAFGEVLIEGPVLFRSTLTPQGPVYEALGGTA